MKRDSPFFTAISFHSKTYSCPTWLSCGRFIWTQIKRKSLLPKGLLYCLSRGPRVFAGMSVS